RAHRDALVVADLDGVDAAPGVVANRLEEPALPPRVEEVEHVPASPAGARRDLARVGEGVHEREILAKRMDDLDRETDARGRRLGLRAGEAERAEAEALERPHVVRQRPPPEHVVADREARERI